MQYTYKIPPSTTEQTLVLDIPDRNVVVKSEAPTVISLTGTTAPPVVVEPPVVTPPTTETRKNLLLETLADGTLAEALKGWSDEQRNKNGYSLTVVDKALRFELRKTDPLISQSVRTEITKTIPAHSWFGGRVKLENWTANTGSGGESIFQVHSGQNAPPFGIVMWGDSIQFTLTPSDAVGSKRIEIGKISDWNNKWKDIVLHLYFAKSGGVVEMWVDGVSVAKVSGLTSADLNLNLKLGQNNFAWAPGGGNSSVTKRVFYWDSIRIGNASATFDDVKP
jgi:hypothetical protein